MTERGGLYTARRARWPLQITKNSVQRPARNFCEIFGADGEICAFGGRAPANSGCPLFGLRKIHRCFYIFQRKLLVPTRTSTLKSHQIIIHNQKQVERLIPFRLFLAQMVRFELTLQFPALLP